MLLDFVNIGDSLLILILVAAGVWLGLIIYCIRDIAASKFKPSFMQFVFLALVLMAPFIGSIIYLAMKKGYRV